MNGYPLFIVMILCLNDAMLVQARRLTQQPNHSLGLQAAA